MKRVLLIAFACSLVFCTTMSHAEEFTYSDFDLEVSFTVPAGWEDLPVTDGNESIKAQYYSPDNMGTIISFAVLDMWTGLGYIKYDIQRRAIDFSALDEEIVRLLSGPLDIQSIEIKTIGSYQYYFVTSKLERTKYGLYTESDAIQALTMQNGYLLLFTYNRALFDNCEDRFPVFECMMETVKID